MNEQLKKAVAVLAARTAFLKNFFQKPQSKKKLVLKIVAVCVGAFIIVVVAVGFSVYRGGARGGVSGFIARVLPFPVAVLRWHVVTYSEYVKDLTALEHFYARQQEQVGMPLPDNQTLEKAVVDRLVRNIAMNKIAKEKGISVTQEELTNQFKETTAQLGTEEEATALIKDLYGWSNETFKSRVLFYYLLEEKVLASYGGDEQAFVNAVKAEVEKLSEKRFLGK